MSLFDEYEKKVKGLPPDPRRKYVKPKQKFRPRPGVFIQEPPPPQPQMPPDNVRLPPGYEEMFAGMQGHTPGSQALPIDLTAHVMNSIEGVTNPAHPIVFQSQNREDLFNERRSRVIEMDIEHGFLRQHMHVTVMGIHYIVTNLEVHAHDEMRRDSRPSHRRVHGLHLDMGGAPPPGYIPPQRTYWDRVILTEVVP